MTICPVEAEMFYPDGRADRYDGANSSFFFLFFAIFQTCLRSVSYGDIVLLKVKYSNFKHAKTCVLAADHTDCAYFVMTFHKYLLFLTPRKFGHFSVLTL